LNIRVLTIFLFSLLALSCRDPKSSTEGPLSEDPGPRLIVDNIPNGGQEQDVFLLVDELSPAGADAEPQLTPEQICETTTTSEPDEYCLCFPECCDRQRWYCPPNPAQTIDVMNVIVEICDQGGTPCLFGQDENCPPPEILFQSECTTQWECPPGTSGEFVEWFECQLEDGTLGRQQVLCNKGNLVHLPCQPCSEEDCNGLDDDCDGGIDEGRFPCENDCGQGQGYCVNLEIVGCDATGPSDERCNYEDDDCDGLIDENQRNVCDECGPVPVELCNNIDDDCDGVIDEELIQECETLCGVGFETCDLGNWISCTVAQPSEEVDPCDGADQDCDGLIDEGLNCDCTIQDVGVLIPCSEEPLRCGQGFKSCQCDDPPGCTQLSMSECLALCAQLEILSGQPCDPYTGMEVANEICNNFDEDCDSRVDEEIQVACYTGPEGTLDVGVCHAGNMICQQGQWGNNDRWDRFQRDFCKDEVVPSTEVCDGSDNDCDGVADYGEEIRDTDILFILDWSGSMDGTISAVRAALNRFAAHFQAESKLHWGLVVGPKEDARERERLYLVSDIAPFADFLASFAALNGEGMGTSEEMLRDALYFVTRDISQTADFDVSSSQWLSETASTPSKENFKINWRQNVDKIAIVFTDEQDQSWLTPEITRETITSTLAGTIRFKLYTFVSANDSGMWPNWATQTGGRSFELTWNQNQMYENLMSIIDEACLPPEQEQGALIQNFSNRYIYSSFHLRYDHNIKICY